MRSPALARIASLAIAIGLSLAVAGCSNAPATGEIRGKVTFKGQPVTEGTVTFLNLTDGGGGEGQIEQDGRYAVMGAIPVGEYVVEIKPLMHMVDTDPGKSPPAPMEKPAPNIPRKYRMQGSTPLKEAVKSGQNEINFDMKP